MVLTAIVETNIRTVVPDVVDKMHRISYESKGIILKDYGGRNHVLKVYNGELCLGDIQFPENPVVKALAGWRGWWKSKSNKISSSHTCT